MVFTLAEFLNAVNRFSKKWPETNTFLVQSVSSLTNQVLLRTHILENNRSIDDLQQATYSILDKQSEARKCLESLFELYLDIQSSLQSFLSFIDTSIENDMENISKSAVRARTSDIAGELLSMFAAELCLKQAILVGLSPRDCNKEDDKIGLTTGQESDKEYLLTCVSAIAAEVYISKERVESLLEALIILLDLNL